MRIITVQNIPGCFNIAIVASRFNQEITRKLFDGTVARLEELGFDKQQLTAVWVPGAIEIPLAAQQLARSENYAAIICLGAVVFGETRHFDYVCEQVSQGCQQVSLAHHIPVIFGVLTTNTMQQAHERAGGKKGHMGRAAADAAYELVSVLRQVGTG